MAVASEKQPWEIGSAIPGAQVRKVAFVNPTQTPKGIFSDDSKFRAPNDRRITFGSLPLPCLPWRTCPRASLTVRRAATPRFSHLGADFRAHW